MFIDSRLFGGRLVWVWDRSGRYILRENHPLVLVSAIYFLGGGHFLTCEPDLFLGLAWHWRVFLSPDGMASDVKHPQILGSGGCYLALRPHLQVRGYQVFHHVTEPRRGDETVSV